LIYPFQGKSVLALAERSLRSPRKAGSVDRRRFLTLGAAGSVVLGAPSLVRATGAPVSLGFDGEFGIEGSTSAQAIEAGISIAIDQINAAGGVLGGRPLALHTRDNRTMPARAARNLREFAQMPDLAAVFCGRLSPTVIETLGLVHELRLPLLDPWASADGIITHDFKPSFTFRLSMRDSWAMPVMANYAARRRWPKVGLLAMNTAWGRSGHAALTAHLRKPEAAGRLVGTRWFNVVDEGPFLAGLARELRLSGAQAIIFIGNNREGSSLLRALAASSDREHLPVLAHSGVMGGDFFAQCEGAIGPIDVAVVQTFGFVGSRRPRAAAVRAAAVSRFGTGPRAIASPAGLAQAYDLTHMVARAIDLAGSTERERVRDALERLPPYLGLIRDYPAPFTPARHEALSAEDLYMARFDAEGVLLRAS
jgi:branched-chain amino acid transport system substrate-binding protein